MKTSKALLKEAGLKPKLRLGTKTKHGVVSNGPHKVKMKADKIIKGPHPKTGKEIEFVRYLLEENGEEKTYQTKKLDDKGELSYLVQRLAEIDEGQEVILEMKKQGIKNYIEVSPVSGSERIEIDEENEEDELHYPTAEEEGINHDDNPFMKKDGEENTDTK